MKSIKVILEDDWEIHGNGSGNVAAKQYIPLLFYLDILNKYNIKATFFPDLAHYDFLNKNNKIRNYRIQELLWNESLLLIMEKGHEVGLHIHPQWLSAEIKENGILLGNEWNIGSYTIAEQEYLIEQGVEHINNMYKEVSIDMRVSVFKAGSWSMHPSGNILSILYKNDIGTILGPIKNTVIPRFLVDYSKMESPFYPYICDWDDISKIAKVKLNPMTVIIPITPLKLNLQISINYLISRARKSINKWFDQPGDQIKHLNNLKSPIKPNKKNMYWTHMKLNGYSFQYLKSTFNKAISTVDKIGDKNYILIVIESHSKLFKNYYKDIELFFNYIFDKYGDRIEFMTVTDFVKSKKNEFIGI